MTFHIAETPVSEHPHVYLCWRDDRTLAAIITIKDINDPCNTVSIVTEKSFDPRELIELGETVHEFVYNLY